MVVHKSIGRLMAVVVVKIARSSTHLHVVEVPQQGLKGIRDWEDGVALFCTSFESGFL